MFKHLKKTILLTALTGISISLYSANALSESYVITDFRFGMNNPSFSDWDTAATSPRPYGGTPYGTLVEGTYQGTSTTNDLVRFTFFGVTSFVYVYTDSANQLSANTPAGTIPGGPQPTINRATLTADMSSWFATWNGTGFNQGNNSNFSACATNPLFSSLSSVARVVDHLDNTFTVSWNSCITGGTFNSQIGFWKLELFCDMCPLATLGAADYPIVSQGGNTTRTVTTTGGDVTITSSLGAAPVGHTFLWTSETDNGITDSDAVQGTFTFDPTGLTPGIYIFSDVYQFVNTRGRGKIAIRVVASTTGDMNDDDNDGIDNDNDSNTLVATQLQSVFGNSTTHVLQSDTGTLTLGQTAFCANKAARISMADIANYGSDTCTAPSNSDDSLIKATGVGGLYDFNVDGLSLGATAQIVIPLTEAIPAQATYRKYSENEGWVIFVEGNGDALASAASSSTGICPAPGSSNYTSGLNKGHTCLQLTITDGGLNDADGVINGQIKDPGGIAEIQSGVEANLASGCSMTSVESNAANHADWLVVLGFIGLLGWFSVTRSKV